MNDVRRPGMTPWEFSINWFLWRNEDPVQRFTWALFIGK